MKTAEEREKTPAYIVLCPTCGQMIGAHVDDGQHKKDVAKFVGQHIKAGFTVERKTVADARCAEWCACKKEKA